MTNSSVSALSERSIAVVLITLTRYLAERDPGLSAYLRLSITHATQSSLLESDLDALRLVLGSIGG